MILQSKKTKSKLNSNRVFFFYKKNKECSNSLLKLKIRKFNEPQTDRQREGV